MTYKDIVEHTGLRTNVNLKTRAQWLKRVGESFYGDTDFDVRKYEEQLANPIAGEVEA
jgi:hypothetical protein